MLVKRLKDYLGTTPRTITAFFPFSDEPNLTPLAEELLEKGWIIGYPALENNHLAFRSIKQLGNLTKNPQTNLSEPTIACPLTDRKTIDIVIVPGRAFTAAGDRLGRGNGGYDKWIHEQRTIHSETTYVGVCFECQLLPSIVTEPHDERMNAVVTAKGNVMAGN